MALICSNGILVLVKEAHICSQAEDHRAEDHSSFYNQLQVDDMYCQLAPGGYVAACTHTRDKFVNQFVIS